jgi:aspartyl-tRNA(Asn)/glutamyl-tRNA(Gln) amidotransferase subunit C
MPDPTPLSTSDVLKVAKLARLALPPEQIEDYRSKLAAIIGYANRLQHLDLARVEPLSSPMEVTSVLGQDIPGGTLTTDVLMQMAPETYPPFVRVPKVIGE